MNDKTRFDKTMDWLKNQKTIALILVGVAIYLGASTLFKVSVENYQMINEKVKNIDNKDKVNEIGRKIALLIDIGGDASNINHLMVTEQEYNTIGANLTKCLGEGNNEMSDDYQTAITSFDEALNEMDKEINGKDGDIKAIIIKESTYLEVVYNKKNKPICKMDNCYFVSYIATVEGEEFTFELLIYDNKSELRICPGIEFNGL